MKHTVLACTGILLTAACSARADINSILATWNLVTYNDLHQIGEVEGRSFIGGDVTKINSFQFAMGNYASPAEEVATAIRGNVVAGDPIQVHHGSVVIGGTANGRVFSMNSGGTVSSGNAWAATHAPLSEISAATAAFSSLAANSATSINAAGSVVFNCAASSPLAVFNVTDAGTFERLNLQGFRLAPDALTETVLINVNSLDGKVDWAQGNFFDLFQQDYWQGRVLFNFHNATELTLHDQFTGYVLAPNADVNAGSHNIDGGLVCNNLLSIGEIHLPDQSGVSTSTSWQGVIPVPEPTTGSLALLGLALIAGVRSTKR
jgi:choice-of-anchor A domain-containing protein